jgi:cell fate regulator YaaT (PSP1 superfamily)
MSEAGATKRIVAIRFQPLGKLYYFDSASETDLRAGDQVLVMTSRGRELGEVVFHVADPGEPPEGTWKPIERRATAQELVMRRMWQRRELEAMIDCRAKAAEIGLHQDGQGAGH